MASTVSLSLSSINADVECQSRKTLNHETIQHYADRMKEGDKFPPVVVYESNDGRYLSEGFHRYNAAKTAGLVEIECDVRDGSKRDAVWNSIRSNADHGDRRTREDVRWAIEKALKDPVWAEMSDRAIAEHVRCHQTTVGAVRKQVSNLDTTLTKDAATSNGNAPKNTRIGKDGKRQAATKPKKEKKPTEPKAEAKKEPEPKPTPSSLDSHGNEIPENLADVFKTEFDFRALEQLLAEVQTHINVICRTKIGAVYPFNAIRQKLADVAQANNRHVPVCVCGDCSGKGCTKCGKRGFFMRLHNPKKVAV